MKKKVIVACGGAVATSTIAANAIVELAKENNIDIEIAQVRISEIASNLPADLIVTTSKVKRLWSTSYYRNAICIRIRCR